MMIIIIIVVVVDVVVDVDVDVDVDIDDVDADVDVYVGVGVDFDGDVKISNAKSKIKFELDNSILISKLIDGKFPNYIQVIPKENQKKLEIELKSFLNSVDRVASVSLDKKDGVKFNLKKNMLDMSVNNTNSGDGKESLSVKFDHELDISFNSRYLIDVASQLDGDQIEIYLKDTGSPALIRDPADFDSIYVVMPMKG